MTRQGKISIAKVRKHFNSWEHCNYHFCSANGTVAHFGGLSDDALSLSDTVSQQFSPEVEHALLGVQFIAQHIRDNDKDNEVIQSKFM